MRNAGRSSQWPLRPVFDVDRRVGAMPVGNSYSPVSVFERVAVFTHALMDGPNRIIKDGNYLYVACEVSRRLLVIDVSTPTAPVLTGATAQIPPSTRGVVGVCKLGSYCFVTSGSGTGTPVVTSIDVSNPLSPTVVSTVSTVFAASSIVGSGSNVFVAVGGNDTLTSFDVSNPAAMTLTQALSLTAGSGPTHLIKDGVYCYVACITSDQVKSVDVTNPAAMTVASTISTGAASDPVGLGVLGSVLYAACSATGQLRAISITNPASLSNLYAIGGLAGAFDAVISGTHAYVPTFTVDSLSKIDISDPSNMIPEASTAVSDGPIFGVSDGAYVYLTCINADAVNVVQIGAT